MVTEQKNSYFTELTRNLHHAGLTVCHETDGLLPMELNGQPLCLVTPTGGVRYKEEDVISEERRAILDQVIDIAGTTAEYMRQMAAAPLLTVGGLEGDYRLLVEFNGAVLAGHQTKYGVQFITWQRDYDGSGICLGHYFSSEDYDAAKQDFAVRAGLVHEESLLELEQKEPDTPEYSGMSFC